METIFFGIQRQNLANLLAACTSAATGSMFLYLSLNNLLLTSGHTLFIAGLSPVQYACAGLGFVLLISSVFFIRESFRDGFFRTGSLWDDSIRFCQFMIFLWLLLYCFDFILPLITTLLTVVFHGG